MMRTDQAGEQGQRALLLLPRRYGVLQQPDRVDGLWRTLLRHNGVRYDDARPEFKRGYTIREANPDGTISDVGAFNVLTREQAMLALELLAA